MTRPPLTFVFPTRNRGALAALTLESLCAHAPPEAEVIVADNSDPATPPIAPPDGRTTILARPTPYLPMSANWERALERARGEWVVFLSDRYHLVGGATTELLAALGDDVRVARYTIASFVQTAPSGLAPEAALRHGPGRVSGALGDGAPPERLPTRPILDHYLTRPTYLASAPMLYTAAVRRDVIDGVVRRAGRFFTGSAPDVASAIHLAASVDEFLSVGRPLVVAHFPSSDEAAWSNGSAVTRHADRAAAFLAENAPACPLLRELPALGASFVFETVLGSARLHGLLGPTAERRLWRGFVEKAVAEILSHRRSRAALELARLSRAARPLVSPAAVAWIAARATAQRLRARLRDLDRGAGATAEREGAEPSVDLAGALRLAQDAWRPSAVAG